MVTFMLMFFYCFCNSLCGVSVFVLAININCCGKLCGVQFIFRVDCKCGKNIIYNKRVLRYTTTAAVRSVCVFFFVCFSWRSVQHVDVVTAPNIVASHAPCTTTTLHDDQKVTRCLVEVMLIAHILFFGLLCCHLFMVHRCLELQYTRRVIKKMLPFNFGEDHEVRVLFKTMARDTIQMSAERTRHIIAEMYAATKKVRS